MDPIKLKEILEKHLKWLRNEDDGERANLSEANLSGADLRRANLSEADLSGADLCRADLSEASLSEADLRRANLCRANLSEADLREADLRRANLCRANLSGADLRRADLSGADLCRASLSEASLSEASLSEVENIYFPLMCPDTGAFIAWKKARDENTGENVIVKLLIPEDAIRTSAAGRKCRCDRAEVVEIQDENGETIPGARATSKRDSSFRYVPGEVVSVANFDKNRWNECAPGIHFFITRGEAVVYRA